MFHPVAELRPVKFLLPDDPRTVFAQISETFAAIAAGDPAVIDARRRLAVACLCRDMAEQVQVNGLDPVLYVTGCVEALNAAAFGRKLVDDMTENPDELPPPVPTDDAPPPLDEVTQ